MESKNHKCYNVSIIKNKNYNIFYNIGVDIAVSAFDNLENSPLNGPEI